MPTPRPLSGEITSKKCTCIERLVKLNNGGKIIEVAINKTQMRTLRDDSKKKDLVHTFLGKEESALQRPNYCRLASML